MTTPKRKVLSLRYPGHAGEEYIRDFEAQGYEIYHVDPHPPSERALTIADIATQARTNGPFAAAMILMGTPAYEPIDADLLSPLLPHVKLVVSASAGYNEFDVDWMTRHGIVFCNSRNAVSESTADMAIYLMLAVLRNASVAERQIREGGWRGDIAPTRDPSGMVLGIVGMGAIGKHIARKALAFNMRIAYHNRRQLPPAEEAALGATYHASLPSLLSAADVVSISTPLNATTTGLIGAPEFAAMKDGAFLVNTARGAVLDEPAFIAALKSGKICRAGLDVFVDEPNIDGFFRESDKVVVQPHMGGLTDVAWQRAFRECMENVKAFFATGKAISPVNVVE